MQVIQSTSTRDFVPMGPPCSAYTLTSVGEICWASGCRKCDMTAELIVVCATCWGGVFSGVDVNWALRLLPTYLETLSQV